MNSVIDMSERSGRRSRRTARSQCQVGKHRYGSPQPIGAGILRRVCTACFTVSIDLTAIEEPVGAGPMFAGRKHLDS